MQCNAGRTGQVGSDRARQTVPPIMQDASKSLPGGMNCVESYHVYGGFCLLVS